MDIRAEAVSMTIDGRSIFEDVSLACPPGSMTALVGPSGSGKTTLLHCLGLLQQPTAGRILVDGVDTRQWRARRRRVFWRDSASFVLQDYGIMEDESAGFNVTLRSSPLGSKTLGDMDAMRAALAATGLADRETETAARLSGGERQRLAVARAIYKDASVVFVDEPTASLDAENRSRVIDLFLGLAQRGCVVVATHDDEMMQACTRRHDIGRGALDASTSVASGLDPAGQR